MTNTRSGTRSAEDDQFLVFSNGTCLEHPAYEKASNGFVRGPKGEKIGRGWAAEEKAKEMCRDYINRYILAFSKMGHHLVGVTADFATKVMWRDEPVTWTEKKAPPSIQVSAKCYFAEHPDAYEVYTFKRHVSSTRGYYTINHYGLIYTNPAAYDKEGLLDAYWTTDEAKIHVALENPGWEPIRSSMENFRDAITRWKAAFEIQYVRVEWSTDLDELFTKIEEYLDAKETIQRLGALLPQIADLYQELGYSVAIVGGHDGHDENISTLKIESDDHVVVLSATPAVHCNLERDEARLTNLQKLRLEEELRASVGQHGDIRHADTDELT